MLLVIVGGEVKVGGWFLGVREPIPEPADFVSAGGSDPGPD